jgi:hypothetical protein
MTMMTMTENSFGTDYTNFQGAPGYDAPANPALSQGAPMEMRPIPKELTEALRAEFARLIEGDRFLENLALLENLARTTRGLTMTIGVVPKGSAPQSPQAGVYMAGGNVWTGPVPNGPIGTKYAEQFGARAIRELVTLVPEIAAKVAQSLRQSPANLVEAIHSAKEKGLVELAAKLEAKLLDAIDDVEPAPVPAVHDHPHTNGTTNGAAAVESSEAAP